MSTGFERRMMDPELMLPSLRARTVAQALSEITEHLARAGIVRDAEELARRLQKRERDGSTGLGGGVAFPHCRVDGLADVVLSVGVSGEGIDFGAPDGIPITLIFLMLSPQSAPALHLQALARLTRLLRQPGLPDRIRSAGSAAAIAAVLRDAETDSVAVSR